jgi:hypothetical protein
MKSTGVFLPAQIGMVLTMMYDVDPATCYDLVTLLRVNPVMLEHGVPADGPAAAVGVVTVGHGQAVEGDSRGVAFNARAVTVAAQVEAREQRPRRTDRDARLLSTPT